ncbi:hypothetical protein F5144DRAFT_603180 [Chaetomium tenue]|uniref:Uncharacterized protein n=1 Tax=Chaetomium tenue TaxID=1854479 RepID=A0ACB7PAF8_9PEZI|nr:hypothetical protein F5144DRAFT_603180 [Chaetomium globosum]
MAAARDRRDAVEDPAASVLYLIAPADKDDAESNKLNLEGAFEWSATDIITWIQAVISNVDGHRKAKLTEMAKLLVDLCFFKDGNVYVVGEEFDKYLPAHHIARTRENKEANREKPEQWYYTLAPLDFFDISLFSPYDVLGYLLATLGKEPPNANKQSFYLPLTAMYAKWCSTLCGRDEATPASTWKEQEYRPGKRPTVYQCTWVGADHNEDLEPLEEGDEEGDEEWEAPRFALGAAFAGCDFLEGDEDYDVRNSWRVRIIEKRKELLQGIGALPADEKLKQPFSNSPWGHCAETYALLAMLK